MVAEQIKQINLTPSSIILEPVGRNTAPAVAVAAREAVKHHEDPLLLVLPADHVMKDIEAFHNAVNSGSSYALEGKLITFGIDASHGWERIHWDALESLARLLTIYMQSPSTFRRDSHDMGSRAGFPTLPG